MALELPNGFTKVDTLEYQMADSDGTLLGNGFSDIKESKLFFNKRWAFWIGSFSGLSLLGIYTLSEELTISIIIIVIGCICLLL